MSKQNNILTYQDYVNGIDKLNPEQQLSLLQLLSARLKKQIGSQSDTGKHSITELDGLGAEIWNDVETEHYVQEERNTWD